MGVVLILIFIFVLVLFFILVFILSIVCLCRFMMPALSFILAEFVFAVSNVLGLYVNDFNFSCGGSFNNLNGWRNTNNFSYMNRSRWSANNNTGNFRTINISSFYDVPVVNSCGSPWIRN